MADTNENATMAIGTPSNVLAKPTSANEKSELPSIFQVSFQFSLQIHTCLVYFLSIIGRYCSIFGTFLNFGLFLLIFDTFFGRIFVDF